MEIDCKLSFKPGYTDVSHTDGDDSMLIERALQETCPAS